LFLLGFQYYEYYICSMKKVIVLFIAVLFIENIHGQNPTYLSFIDGSKNPGVQPEKTELTIQDDHLSGVSFDYRCYGAWVNRFPVQGDFYDMIRMEGFQLLTQVGAPALPAHIQMVAIPEGSQGKIVILDSRYTEYDGFNIHPALMPASDTKGAPDPIFERDPAIYGTNAFFPEAIASIGRTILLRGIPILLVQVAPVQFNPVSGKIRVYSTIRFRIEFSGGQKTFLAIGKSNKKSFTDQLKRIVTNPGSIPDGISESDALLDPGANDYIIITHASYLSAANDLANWKRQLGYKVEVVSQSSWTSTQVKTEIQNRYNAWNPHPGYFVIIGDDADVPGETVLSRWSPYPSFKTDNYYACMDGVTDYVPDMARGRISVSSLTEANIVVQKIIAYEKNPVDEPAFYSTALHCAAYQDTDDYNTYADRRFCQTSEEVRDYILGCTTYLVERVYQTNDAVTPTYWNNTWYSAGEAIPSELLRSNGFPWKGGYHPGEADIITAINDGRFYLLHRDHGYTGGTGWADPYFTTWSSIPSLTNGSKLPVVFSINCHTGEFQLAECFAEKLIRFNNGGAVGVIAAAHSSPSGYNDAFAMGLFDAIWSNPGLTPNFTGLGGSQTPPDPHSDIYTMGDVLNHGLIRQVQTWSGNDSWNSFEHELMHYFGDPAMKIWTSDPNVSPVTATHASSISCSNTSFSIANSTPYATATLVYNNSLLGKTILSSSGSGSIPYTLTCPGTAVTLTISHDNQKPYETSLPVISGPPSTLALQNISVPGGTSVCSDATQTITVAGGGTSYSVQNGADVTLIAGQNILILPTTTISSGGYLHAFITTSG